MHAAIVYVFFSLITITLAAMALSAISLGLQLLKEIRELRDEYQQAVESAYNPLQIKENQ